MEYSAAEQILTINNNNLERAINFHLEGNPDAEQAGPSNQIAGSSRSSGSNTDASTSSTLLPNMPTLVRFDHLIILKSPFISSFFYLVRLMMMYVHQYHQNVKQ